MKLKQKTVQALAVATLSAAIIVGVSAQPARADLEASIAKIMLAMRALESIAETGVSIVVVPFGIGFALKIAGHVLRAGT